MEERAGAQLTLFLKAAAMPLDHGYRRWCSWAHLQRWDSPTLSSVLVLPPPPRQRLTLGQMVAELDIGQRTRKVDVLKIGGTGSVVIKHCRKPQLGSPGDVVLDVDVSLRHADVTLGTDECTGLCALLAAYFTHVEESAVDIATDESAAETKPIKPLFREDFWYFEGSSNNTSRDLNFDTLSGLLEQVLLFYYSGWPCFFLRVNRLSRIHLSGNIGS